MKTKLLTAALALSLASLASAGTTVELAKWHFNNATISNGEVSVAPVFNADAKTTGVSTASLTLNAATTPQSTTNDGYSIFDSTTAGTNLGSIALDGAALRVPLASLAIMSTSRTAMGYQTGLGYSSSSPTVDYDAPFSCDFTLTLAAGHGATLSSISYDIGFQTTVTTAQTYYYRTFASLDNGASFIDLGPDAGLNWVSFPSSAAGYSFANVNISLSSLSALNGDVASERSVIFKVVLAAQGTVNTRAMALDNIIISGTIAPVPEPSTYAIIAALGVLAFTLRRRKS